MRLTKAQAMIALSFAAAVAIGNAWTLVTAIAEQRGFTTILVFAVSTVATALAVGIAFYLLWPRPRHRQPAIQRQDIMAAIERDRARIQKWAANL